jgi:hypothetical protein
LIHLLLLLPLLLLQVTKLLRMGWWATCTGWW